MKHIRLLKPLSVTLALIVFLLVSTYAADQSSLTPSQAWQRLKDGNERFADDRPAREDVGAARRKELVGGQSPYAIVLGCADSRVSPEIIFDEGLGKLFVVRVAGNISEPFALGSIEYAVEHLHVPLIVVLGHEKCGAVAAALETNKPGGNLGKVVGEIHAGEHLAADKDAALAEAVENNVQYQAKLLTDHSDVIREYVKRNDVKIVAGVYSLASGKVRWIEVK
jgi:carbonic anhydrase